MKMSCCGMYYSYSLYCTKFVKKCKWNSLKMKKRNGKWEMPCRQAGKMRRQSRVSIENIVSWLNCYLGISVCAIRNTHRITIEQYHNIYCIHLVYTYVCVFTHTNIRGDGSANAYCWQDHPTPRPSV